MLAVSVNSTHCFSAAVDDAAAAAAVAAVFESCPSERESERASERGRESARAALGERTLAARGAVDRTDGRTDEQRGTRRGSRRPRSLRRAGSTETSSGSARTRTRSRRRGGRGETTLLPKNERPQPTTDRGGVPRFSELRTRNPFRRRCVVSFAPKSGILILRVRTFYFVITKGGRNRVTISLYSLYTVNAVLEKEQLLID